MCSSEMSDGDGGLALEAFPAPGLVQAFSCCPASGTWTRLSGRSSST